MATSLHSLFTSTLSCVNTMLPDSSCARSSRSETSCSSISLFFSTMAAISSLSFLLTLSWQRSREKPMMEFSGVRISWLIDARNAVFILSADSARSFASMRFCSMAICSVTFCVIALTSTTLCSGSYLVTTENTFWKSQCPSFSFTLTRACSLGFSPRFAASRKSVMWCRSSG